MVILMGADAVNLLLLQLEELFHFNREPNRQLAPHQKWVICQLDGRGALGRILVHAFVHKLAQVLTAEQLSES